MPLLFASESDWADCNALKPDKSIKKEYDFIYICLKVDDKKKKNAMIGQHSIKIGI